MTFHANSHPCNYATANVSPHLYGSTLTLHLLLPQRIVVFYIC